MQTVMRRYKLEQPYEQLKAFTRGKQIDKATLQQFIADLALPEKVKKQLLDSNPCKLHRLCRKIGKKDIIDRYSYNYKLQGWRT